MTSIRRFYSNAYTDAEKQDAINLFLGNFVPQHGHAALWELDSDYFLHAGVASCNANGREKTSLLSLVLFCAAHLKLTPACRDAFCLHAQQDIGCKDAVDFVVCANLPHWKLDCNNQGFAIVLIQVCDVHR